MFSSYIIKSSVKALSKPDSNITCLLQNLCYARIQNIYSIYNIVKFESLSTLFHEILKV